MEYVMVPVPAELEDEIAEFLMRLHMISVSRSSTNLDRDAVDRFVPQFNERCRDALTLLSQRTLARKVPTIADVAAWTGWSPYESAGVVQELSELIWTSLGPFFSFSTGKSADLAAGVVDWSVRTVIVWKELAEAVVALDAARADAT